MIPVLAFLERPIESSVTLGILLAGVPAYYILRKRKSRIETGG